MQKKPLHLIESEGSIKPQGDSLILYPSQPPVEQITSEHCRKARKFASRLLESKRVMFNMRVWKPYKEKLSIREDKKHFA